MPRLPLLPRTPALALVLPLILLAPSATAEEPASSELEAAAEAFDEYNYQTALDRYTLWLEAQPDPLSAEAVQVQRNMTLCQLYLAQYDAALLRLRELAVSDGLDIVLRADVERSLGDLHFALPGRAYLRDGQLHFDPDEYEGEYVWRWDQNMRDGFAHLGRAKLLVDGALRAQRAGIYATDEDLTRWVIDFDLELASRLEQNLYGYSTGPALDPADGGAGADLPADPTFDPRWPEFVQVLFLFHEAEQLAVDEGDPAQAAWALYRQALFLNQRFPPPTAAELMALPEDVVPILLPEPLPEPTEVVERLLKAYPGIEREDLYVYSHARFVVDGGHGLEGEAELEAFLERFPDSGWAGDARSDLEGLRHPQLTVSTVNVIPPGGGHELHMSGRNVDQVRFKAYRVDLLAVLGHGGRLRNPHVSFGDFERNFGSIDGVRKHYLEEVAAWTVDLDDPGDHSWIEDTTLLPLGEPGAYVVESTGAKLDHAFLVIVSDVTVLVQRDEGGSLVFVADAKTGDPLEAFPLILKETYWDYRARGRYRTRLTRALSGPDGTYRHADDLDGISTDTLAVLAAEGDRLAVTGEMWLGTYHAGWGEGESFKAFSTTDRPVYRPEQTVHFKHVIRAVREGAYANVPGTKVRVKVFDPQGSEVLDQVLTTSEFGSVHGSFTLGEEPPLGVYSTALELVETEQVVYLSSGSTFRVEEYRKPEFEVAVTAAKTEVRPGAEVPVDIQATYFFGAPVGEARVVYRVFSTILSYEFPRPGPYDWLYGPGYGIVHERPYVEGKGFVDQGELITDEDGRATLLLELPEDDDFDHTYEIHVEVTDLARRTIEGTGAVKVTRQPFYAGVFTERGFFSPGDTVEMELRAETPGGVPVPAEGTLRIYRVTQEEIPEDEVAAGGTGPTWRPGPETREVLTLLDERPEPLDRHGRAFTTFVPDEAGAYRAVYSAPAGEGLGDVEATRELWVYDDTFPGARLRFANLELITDRRHYEKGETLRVMVQSPFADPSVLLTMDGAADLIEHRVLSLDGHSTVVEIPLGEAHVPNFFLRAALARDFQVFQTDREIFVPPADRFLDVTVEGDRPDFRPGGEGTFTLSVTDHAGEPVQGEFSLAAVDEAVFGIQRETAGDLRTYFYGDRRFSGVQLQHSRAFYAYALGRDRNRRGDHSITGLPYHGYGFRGGWGDTTLYRGGGGRIQLDEEVAYGAVGHGPSGAYSYAPPASPAEARSRRSESKMSRAAREPARALAEMDGRFDDTGLFPPGSGEPDIRVRSDFRDTAHWEPVLITGEDGRASVTVQWPDSLTTWDVVVRGVDGDTRVGGARVDAVTTKPLLVRLLAPRFLVEEDRLLLTAVVNNRGPADVEATVEFALPPDLLAPRAARDGLVRQVQVPAGGQVRVDLPVTVLRPGDATVTAKVIAGDEGDAVQSTYPVLTWGAEKMLTRSAVLRDGGQEILVFDVPKQRKVDSAVLTVHLNPSLASVMLDAVPYLIDYPYGCVEQTMSRFMPAALVADTLDDLGVDFADIRAAARQPGLLGEEAEQLARWDDHPVTHRAGLDRVVRRSLARLYAFQHGDGGWAWWRGGDSDAYMTAYVVDGLQVASDAGYAVDPLALGRGYNHLKRRFFQAERRGEPWWDHRRVYMAYVLGGRAMIDPSDLDEIYERRNELSTYGKALLALSLHRLGDAERAGMVVENLSELARVDERSGSASFDHDEGDGWWAWYNDRVETNAWALRAFLAIAPEDPLCDGLMQWLVANRRGNRWHSTRDTAQVVRALSDYIRSRDELSPDYGLTVRLNGTEIHEAHVDRKSLFRTRSQVVLTGDAIADGENRLEVETAGRGSLYVTAYLTYFTVEKRIAASGNRIHVTREYSKLTPKTGERDTPRGTIDVLEYDRTPLRDGARVESGELIEVQISVESDNVYEYLVFEDFKPAGFEPDEVKSGYLYDNGTWFNMELRDEKVAFFLSRLRQGRQVLDYRLRAETPGTFRALPHSGYAMYAPRIRALSDSFELTVVDRPVP